MSHIAKWQESCLPRVKNPFQIQSSPEITLMGLQPFSPRQTWSQQQKSLLKDLHLGILVSELSI